VPPGERALVMIFLAALTVVVLVALSIVYANVARILFWPSRAPADPLTGSYTRCFQGQNLGGTLLIRAFPSPAGRNSFRHLRRGRLAAGVGRTPGVMSDSISRRTREIGVRVALGSLL
jgi:hypothetical protein